jgi:hypothetical protein
MNNFLFVYFSDLKKKEINKNLQFAKSKKKSFKKKKKIMSLVCSTRKKMLSSKF